MVMGVGESRKQARVRAEAALTTLKIETAAPLSEAPEALRA
jgi:hypothetical protein